MSAMDGEIAETVRGFITRNFYLADPAVLQPETSFLDSGLVDSTGVLEVVAFLESTFGIEIADEDLIPQNLDSIQSIVAYVQRKRA